MNIEQTLQELDTLFTTYQIEKVQGFLEEKIAQAMKEQDLSSVITLYNEMIGYCRDTSKYELAVEYCRKAITLMKEQGLEGTIPYATTLLNVANAYRAAGKLEESLAYYRQVFGLYEGNLEPEDFRYASLNNNLSLLYQEMGDFESACEALKKALAIVILYPEARIETAVTYSNLAASLLKLGRYSEAMEDLQKAFEIFEQDEEKDYHYSAALSAMGEAKFRAGEYVSSKEYYEKALQEIEKNVGRTQAYEITKQNLEQVQTVLLTQSRVLSTQPHGLLKQSNVLLSQHQAMSKQPHVLESKGLELCRSYYEEYGKPMIHEKFPEYEQQIAAGLVGEGSECFGFDDVTSRDHDWGPGFCLWVSDEVYAKIGTELAQAYESLPQEYLGFARMETPQGKGRVGVFTISGFYEKYLGTGGVPQTIQEWLYLEDERFATVTNGAVFADPEGSFSAIREKLLAYYPESVRRAKISREIALIAQTGQYNFGRMLTRGEKVTAQLALASFMEHTMKLVYLMNRRYAPFYKWLHHGMDKLTILPEIMDILNAIADMELTDERIPQIIEIIVKLLLDELNKQDLIETVTEDTYLGHYEIQREKEGTNSMEEKNKLIDQLVNLEWKAFDQVKNEGGRADCQDDWNTFSLMRKSQYLAWDEEMLLSYVHDFEEANARGWNLITEKYGRMMESTTPEHYARIEKDLPVISEEKKAIIEEIVKLQVGWMEDFANRYPKSAGNARSIHTSEDTPFNTSYETYLRGELGTYSDETLERYGRFVVGLYQGGKNLAQIIMTNTALLYGYASLEDLESKL